MTEEEYLGELRRAWRRVEYRVDWRIPMWEARGDLPHIPYDPAQTVTMNAVEHSFQFRRQVYLYRGQKIGHIVIGRRDDRKDWTPINGGPAPGMTLGEIL